MMKIFQTKSSSNHKLINVSFSLTGLLLLLVFGDVSDDDAFVLGTNPIPRA